jgi:hypothetical protein
MATPTPLPPQQPPHEVVDLSSIDGNTESDDRWWEKDPAYDILRGRTFMKAAEKKKLLFEIRAKDVLQMFLHRIPPFTICFSCCGQPRITSTWLTSLPRRFSNSSASAGSGAATIWKKECGAPSSLRLKWILAQSELFFGYGIGSKRQHRRTTTSRV